MYRIIRFIVVNFGRKFERPDGCWGYSFFFARLKFIPIGHYPRKETLTVGKMIIKDKPGRRPRTMKNEKLFRKLWQFAYGHMRHYEWDRIGDYQIIPTGFVFFREGCEYLDRESIYLGIRIKRLRHWIMLNDHIFIGFHLRHGEDW